MNSEHLSQYLNALNWRYATKGFDPSRKLADDQIAKLMEAARLSPSSYGLQPWGFVVVKDSEVRKELSKHAFDQPQITEASHLVVLCSCNSITAEFVDQYIKSTAEIRGQSVQDLSGFRKIILDNVRAMDPKSVTEWATHQVYIALGMLLSACAISNVDACPMEGFNRAEFDRVLELGQKGLGSRALCAIGYRASSDKSAARQKSRFPPEQVINWI